MRGHASPKFNTSPGFYLSGNGEQAQTYFMERQKSNHRFGRSDSIEEEGGGHSSPPLKRNNNNRGSTKRLDLKRSFSGTSLDLSRQPLITYSERQYGSSGNLGFSSVRPEHLNTIRFQVVVWNIGKLDVVTGSVPMTFRVTLFWNDTMDSDGTSTLNDDLSKNSEDDVYSLSSQSVNVWKMHGRQKAFQQEMTDLPQKAVEVPPLAILNCSTFETIGKPEIDMLVESSRLMRWSCMYRATMTQDNLRVDKFPHDDHNICIKLGILSNRGKGRQWDKRIWKLGLATKDDSQDTTRIPHGVIVPDARIPGFTFNTSRGLEFQFCTLEHGAFDNPKANDARDEFLKVSLNVLRESGYYDKNIIPLVALMNTVAVSVLCFKDTEFFYRALITLNISFVEMSIRMTADSHLPGVDYEIKLQRVLNEFFFILMCLVLEAMAVYCLSVYYHVSEDLTWNLDVTMAVVALIHNFYTVWRYYKSKQIAQEKLKSTKEEA